MWVRLTAILLCIVFFITGCNSLISQFFGTHKLRSLSVDEALDQGLGDADYVELLDAWQTGDYIVVPPKTTADRAVLIFPIVGKVQLEKLDAGQTITPQIIGWTKNFSIQCDDANNCAPRLNMDYQGIVREMRRQKNRAHMLPDNRYQLPEDVVYVEVGRAPLAWYWNLLMMLGGLGLAFYIESKAHWQRKIGASSNTHSTDEFENETTVD